MFSVSVQAFEDSRKIVLNHKSGLSVEILPDFGAAIHALFIQTGNKEIQNVLTDILPGSQGKKSRILPGSILFPFPGQAVSGFGETSSDSEEKETLRHLKFEIVETNTTVEMAFVHLCHKSDAVDLMFPFQFQVDVEFVLTDSDGLTVNTLVTNHGDQEFPFGLGWIPCFQTGSSIEELQLEFPSSFAIQTDENNFPTGKQSPFSDFHTGELIGKAHINRTFDVSREGLHKTIILVSKRKIKLVVWQDANSEGLGFARLETSPNRNSIGIWPLSSLATSLKDRKEMSVLLEPGRTHNMVWGLRF